MFSSIRDGDNEHSSVGHHMGDRSHYIEKKRDKDGRFRQSHKFVNLDQGLLSIRTKFFIFYNLEDAGRFNEEFKARANRNVSGMFNGGNHESNRRAIEGGPSRTHRTSNSRSNEPKPSSSSAPIITIPDDDEDEIIEETRTSSK